jgi:hypothetical protein
VKAPSGEPVMTTLFAFALTAVGLLVICAGA